MQVSEAPSVLEAAAVVPVSQDWGWAVHVGGKNGVGGVEWGSRGQGRRLRKGQ